MSIELFRERVYCLAMRFPWLGASSDIASMTLTELWGLYCLLQRLSDGQP